MSAKKKEAFILAFEKTFGNISQACRAIGVSRRTYYDWIEKDKKFKTNLENTDVSEHLKDFIESALIKKINSGDTASIIFAAKTKLKDRGYIEKVQIESNNKNTNTVEITHQEVVTTIEDETSDPLE